MSSPSSSINGGTGDHGGKSGSDQGDEELVPTTKITKATKESQLQSQAQRTPYVPPHRRCNNTGEVRGTAVAYRQNTSRTCLHHSSHDPPRRMEGTTDAKPPQQGVVPWRTDTTSARTNQHYRRQQGVQRRMHFGTIAVEESDVAILCRVIDRAWCINMESRPDKWKVAQKQAKRVGRRFRYKLERFDAIDGRKLLHQLEHKIDPDPPKNVGGDYNGRNDNRPPGPRFDEHDIQLQWDSTKNALYSSRVTASIKTMTAGEVGCAASHLQLWRELANTTTASDERETYWMILEDDMHFVYDSRGDSRFPKVFVQAWKQLPHYGWGILYLGFSARGERHYVDESIETDAFTLPPSQAESLRVRLYRPTYGFQTHAYVITRSAAKHLLRQLPVRGPLDVWLADNDWFGLRVYCAVIANEGWMLDDGTYEGANLVSQQKNRWSSDVQQSSSLSADASPLEAG